ncbi:hypothetical protein [Methanobrevibacter sp.]|uniref:hypothetical protein n=1 Tax=Methanobrevibacter sp. TaxID=66852 RepID=UPI00386D001E
MKFKRIMLISILVVILTLGAVSASDINETSDDLAINDESFMEVSESCDNSSGLSASDDEIFSMGEGSFSDIQTMIDNAAEGDTIVLSGNEYLGSGTQINVNKSVTLDGNNSTLNAGYASRIFNIIASDVVLKNIILTNADSSSSSGGAVYCNSTDGVNVSIFDCSFVNCNAGEFSGAIYLFCANSAVSGCTFVNCSASSEGGAIHWSGDNGTVSDCSFIACSSVDVNYARGGAIYWEGDNGTVFGCSFVNCSATGVIAFGGAIYWDDDECTDDGTVSGCSFVNCSAEGNCSEGGAIYWNNLNNGLVSDSSFVNCSVVVSGDYDVFGGAIYWASKLGSVSGCSFVNCSATGVYGSGGAMYWFICPGSVLGCSFVNCSATDEGGAIMFHWNDEEGFIKNSSFINNDAGKGRSICVDTDLVSISNSKFIDKKGLDGAISGGTNSNCALVDNLATTTTLTLNATTIIMGDKISITPKVLDQNACINGIVELYVGGQSIGTCNIGEKFVYTPAQVGTYNISAKFEGDEYYLGSQSEYFIVVMPSVVISQNATVGDDICVFMNFGENITGQIIFNVTDWCHFLDIENGIVNDSFSTAKLTAGNHSVTFGYLGNNAVLKWFKEYSNTNSLGYSLNLLPKEVTIPESFESNDDGVIILVFPENATGTVEVFVDGVRAMVVEIINGIAKIDLSKYKGKYNIVFKYSGNEVYAPFTKDALVDVYVKAAKIIASDIKLVYTSKNKYSVKVYDSDGKLASGVKVTFLINNKAYKTTTTGSNGVASIVIGKVPGSYKITVKASSVSVTKKLTVNHLLTLKTVKVKRSAKKLVLTATLKKVNGKYLKKKKVTFKFNGKKYVVKTNKKGVAKVTINSKVLKKLKAGKKVKYQATYLKDTVKKTVKVKK